MEFTLHGVDIYTPEIDDKGIDLVARTRGGQYWEIQVKSVFRSSKVYLDGSRFKIDQPNLLVALVRLIQDEAPKAYLLKSSLWKETNSLFRRYDTISETRDGEYGIQIGKKNESLLSPYSFDKVVVTL